MQKIILYNCNYLKLMKILVSIAPNLRVSGVPNGTKEIRTGIP